MLPKILIGYSGDKDGFFQQENLSENFVLFIDGGETNLTDLREWVTFCQNVLDDEGIYSAVVWNAGRLSAECQSVLLKPLEEKKVMTRMYLLTEKEQDLLPTILSRCEIVAGTSLGRETTYWKDLLKVWKGGPGEILAFAEKFDFEKLEELLNEVVIKINFELQNEVTSKRLTILNIALNTLKDIHQTNVNNRMALENFLICSWKVIKTRQ